MDRDKQSGRPGWLTFAAWFLFAAGLMIQAATPRLEIVNRAFVIPAAISTEGYSIRPDEIVAKERRKQLISALLTAGGAIALAYRYRKVLVGKG